MQSAESLVPGIPPGGVYNTTSPQRIAEIKNIVRSDIQTAFHREPTEEEYGYWLNKFTGENDSGFVTSGQMSADEYRHRRLLGWQAGGEDVAKFGPYAGGSDARGPIPSLPRLGG